MANQKSNSILKETFNTVAAGYDCKALRFFPAGAEYLASILGLRGDEQVLDVATGTGHAALALAARVPRGHITGVDFSASMLDQARRKAASMNSRNVDFLEMDMKTLGFAPGQFDAAVCAFSIFFSDDMDAQLLHIAETVKPNGLIAITVFQDNFFSPLKELVYNKLVSYGVQLPPKTWKRIATEEGCRALFEKAGLQKTRVEKKNLGYYLENAEEWWDVIWNAGFRSMVSQIELFAQERFRREHLQEVAALAESQGIWLDVGVLFVIGTKPITLG